MGRAPGKETEGVLSDVGGSPERETGNSIKCFVTSVRLEMATEFRNMEIFGDLDESTFSGWVKEEIQQRNVKRRSVHRGYGPLLQDTLIPLNFLLPESVLATTSLLILAYLPGLTLSDT